MITTRLAISHSWLHSSCGFFSGKLKFLVPLFLLLTLAEARAQQWPILGNDQQIATGTSNYTTIATATEDVATIPYVAFTEDSVAKVKRLYEGTWQQVGTDVSARATYTRIYIDKNNKVYVSYVDPANGNRLAVKTLNNTSGSWEPLNGDIANLYLSSGTVTVTTGQFATTPRSIMAFDTASVPYIIFGEGAGLVPYVKRFNGTSWETVGAGPITSNRAIGVGLAIDSTTNIPYIVYGSHAGTATTGNMTVYRYINNAWEQIVVPNPVPSSSGNAGATAAVRHTSITFNSEWNPVISYFNAGTGNLNRTTVIIYNKTTDTWSYSAMLSGRDAPGNTITRDRSGNLFAAFIDFVTTANANRARVFKLAAGTTAWVELRNPDSLGIDEPIGNLAISLGQDDKPYVVYTRVNSVSVNTPTVRIFSTAPPPPPPPPVPDPVVTTPKQMENLDRGLVAVRTGENQVYIGWRMLGTDSQAIAFNLYRDGTLLNTSPITTSTNFVDNTNVNGTYVLKNVLNDVEQQSGETASIWAQNYLNIPLQRPPGGVVTPISRDTTTVYSYSPNDASVGDLDGDGEYEVIVKWDPSNSRDNSLSGFTGNVYLDAYKLNGTRLWRIDLGKNIRAGAHYTQFIVYDLDGDGKAEVACKTADGTIDGAGTVIGDPIVNYRNDSGYVLTGPEFLTIFNGQTGAAMASQNYLPVRGSVSSWGDNYGNRVDRFIAAVAYLDGARPSLIMGRGYYTRLVRAAWDWRNGTLTSRWVFDSNSSPANAAYGGQGNHQMTIGDSDGDGKDEIFNGSSAVNDNGAGLWANGMGHGDALHMTDIDPDRPGLEIWQPYETPSSNGLIGAALVDAKTGERIFTVPLTTSEDVGRGLSSNIDPRYKGNESWASRGYLYSAKGDSINSRRPSINFTIWWDADSTRELLDGNTISKWNYITGTSTIIFTAVNCASNNTTKSTPALTADILGDWREEVIFRTTDNNNLRIFTTTALTDSRFYTLMHDPQYRTAVAWQNSAYNQPPHPGFYLGEGMEPLPLPNIYLTGQMALPVTWLQFDVSGRSGVVSLFWKTATETGNDFYTVERSSDGVNYTSIEVVKGAGNSSRENVYRVKDNNPGTGLNYYRIIQTDIDGRFTYSPVKTVVIGNRNGKLSVLPNPVTNTVRLNFSSDSKDLLMIVTNVEGSVILKSNGSLEQLNSQLNNKLPVIRPGIYFLKIMDGPAVYNGRMIKQ